MRSPVETTRCKGIDQIRAKIGSVALISLSTTYNDSHWEITTTGHLEKPGYEKIGLLISAKSLNV